MTIMVGNNSSGLIHWLAGQVPGSVGWLLSPDAGFKEPRAWLPYGIDNGKFNCWSRKTPWSEESFLGLLDRCKLCREKPLWVLVPDEVANRERTLWLWRRWEPMLRRYKWPLAFAVQDGMTPSDVPDEAEVVFVGGSDEFKWRNAAIFAASFPRVHVGRVNWFDKLEYCEKLGVESVDGTGFIRGGELGDQGRQLTEFVQGRRHRELQPELLTPEVLDKKFSEETHP